MDVSLSLLSDELRMPLGGNNATARAAEMVQFTQGDGPCIDTYRTGRPAALGRCELEARWPMYYDAITAATPYQAIMSVPLIASERTVGAMDAYSVDPARPSAAALHDAVALARPLVRAVLDIDQRSELELDDFTRLGHLDNEQTHRRSTNWVAIGLIGRAADLSSFEALDVIRAYALRSGRIIDDVAYDLASHNLTPADVLDQVRRVE